MAMKSRRAGMMGHGNTVNPSWIRISVATLLTGAAILFLFRKRDNHVPTVSNLVKDVGLHDAAKNATLGFGAILIAVMPHRTDQMDTISLLSHFTGLDMTIVPGVDPRSIEAVALPPGDFRPTTPEGGFTGHLGAWRSHLNMLKRVVDEKLSSALILEADVDWDVRIKEQFSKISANMKGHTKDHPYGRDWESMWVGQCRHIPDSTVRRPVAVFYDETVPPFRLQKDTVQNELRSHGVQKDGYRMITKLWGPTCMAGYAVTFEGATKLLYQLGLVGLGGPIDNEICRIVQSNYFGGVVITPPLFAQYKTGTRKDSDIETEVQELVEGEANIRVCSHCVDRSVRQELHEMIYPPAPLDG